MPRLTTKQAAEYIQCSTETLQKMRQDGRGPRYFKPVGLGKVFYETGDIDKWLKEGERKSTADVPKPKRPRGRPRKEAAASA